MKTIIFKLIGTFLGIILSAAVFGQADLSSFSATGRGAATTINTDYHAIGINPSMLGIKPRHELTHGAFGIMEFVANVYMKDITRDEFTDYIRQASEDSMSIEDRILASEIFYGKPINANIDVMWLGFSLQFEKTGGFAFNIKETARLYTDFTAQYTDFAFFGAAAQSYFPQLILNNNDTVATPTDPNDLAQYFDSPYNGIQAGYNPAGNSIGKIVDGSSFKLHWYREFNFTYGREIINKDEEFQLAVGGGLKYLMGVGYADLQAKNGRLTGVAAYNPILNSGAINLDEILRINTTDEEAGILTPIGHGLGFDLGVTAQFKNKYRIGASLLNVGSIVYTRNAHEVRDTVFTTVSYQSEVFSGFDSILSWDAVDKVTVGLPAYLRIGGSMFTFLDKVEIGADIILPLNDRPGNFNKAVLAVGADYYVIKEIKLSSGFNFGGNYATSTGDKNFSTYVNIPFGINFLIGENAGWEFGFATRDIRALFDLQKINYSFGQGILRFRI